MCIQGKYLSLLALPLFLGCQAKEAEAPPLTTTMISSQKPASAVASIARTAQTCWFKSKDKSFRIYRIANEVNSFAGKPRFLIVPRKNPGGLPLLVVEAQQVGGKTSISAFGPLLNTADGRRILGDVNRWSRGETACT
jgi:hypothetical protein